MKNMIIAAVVLFLAVGCNAQKTTVDTSEKQAQAPRQGERPGPPSIDEIFKMDMDNDGKLSASEVKGPLQRDFSKIDSDGDGFITRTELENAPKPQRGGHPPKN